MSVSTPDPPTPRAHPMRPGPGTELVDVDQTFDAAGFYSLRETLAAHASRLGADGDQIDQLLIVATELATNAVRHGGGTGRLRLWHRGHTLYCQVSDDGPGIADPTVGTAAPGPVSDSGRGLWICRNLTTDLTIDTGPDGHGAAVTVAITPVISTVDNADRDQPTPDRDH